MQDVQLPQAKKGKPKQLIGGLGIILGAVIAILGTASGIASVPHTVDFLFWRASYYSSPFLTVGLVIVALSVVCYIYGRIENWWYWK